MPIKIFEYLNPEELLSSEELLNEVIGPDLKDELSKRLAEVHAEKLEEYLAWGLEEGLAKRYAEAYAKDFAIGFVKGVTIEHIKNAIALKKRGVSTAIIASVLNMTPEEVETL